MRRFDFSGRCAILSRREDALLASLGSFREGTVEEFAAAWGCARMTAWHRLEELHDGGRVAHEHSRSRWLHRWRVEG